MKSADSFFEISERQFEFLRRDYNFRHKAKKTVGGIWLTTYQNRTTAVEIAMEWQEQYLAITLCRLVDGKIKENPVMIRPDSEIYCFNLENLLLLKSPAQIVTPDFGRSLSPQDMEKILAQYAHALQKYASDILAGDFQVFPALERMVKDRAKEFSSEQTSKEWQQLAA